MKIDVEILCTACKRGWMESGRVEDGHMNHTVAVCEACAREALAARDEENAELRAEVERLKTEKSMIGAARADWCKKAQARQARIAELERVVRLAAESQGWDGNDPDDDRWTAFYKMARAALTPTETPGK